MDPKDVKPGRPSLLSAPDSNAASSASGARILADMETGGRKAKPRPAARKSRPLLLVLGTVAVAVLAGYYFLASPARIGDAAIAEAAPAADALPASADAEALADAGPEPEPFDSLAANADDSTEFPLPPIPADAQAAGTAAVAAATTQSSVAKTAPRKRADRKRAASRKEAPLMASLLENIEQDQVTASATRTPPPPPLPTPAPPRVSTAAATATAAAREGSPMDVLVQQVSRSSVATASSPAAMRAQTVQAALRNCPRANTRAGLRCREQVCSKFRGQDRACPN